MDLEQKLIRMSGGLDGSVGIYFHDLADDEIVEVNSQRTYSAASTIKIPLVMLMMELVESGKYYLEDVVEISPNNIVKGTGVIQLLNSEYKPTIRELVELAVAFSDNIATNMLIDLVGGPDKVTEYCAENGYADTFLQRKMMDMEAKKAGKDNFTTARDMGKILARIAKLVVIQKDLQSPYNFVFKAMKMQQCRNKLPVMVPAVDFYDVENTTYPPPGYVLVANKTGDLWSTQNDIGIFVLPSERTFIVSIFTDNLKVPQDGMQMISKLGKIIYEYMLYKTRPIL
ncbi:MAG: serine hydrolase [Acidaminococcaceae bacterium]